MAVLILAVGLCAYIGLSSDPEVAEYRDLLLQQLGITDDAGINDPEIDEPGLTEPGDTDSDVTESGKGRSETSISAGDNRLRVVRSDNIPEYDGKNYVPVNEGSPIFPDEIYARAGLISRDEDAAGIYDGINVYAGMFIRSPYEGGDSSGSLIPYEFYGELDDMGRCTVAYGCLGEETMPPVDDERGDISGIHPSGWVRAQRWERCHLIAWALSDEDANECNLVTGTHYMNYDGMRPLEEETEHYIHTTGNHVLYMSRPVFDGDELVPRGVQMTAKSVEDGGRGISFNVFCFNVTPGAEINYETGVVTTAEQAAQAARRYVLNTRSGVFHYPSCEGAKAISRRNRTEVTATRTELTDQGYIPCGYCEP